MRKIAIIYKSGTGNTKLIAKAVAEALSGEEVVYFGEPEEGIEADIYIVGSWTDKGTCVKEIAGFLRNLRGRKIAYFGTAGFGGSEEYYETLYNRVAEQIDESNELIGHFFCQGRMPMSVRNRYVQMIQEHPDDKKMQVSLENFDRALSHPDERDLEEVKEWAKGIVESVVAKE